MGLQYLRISPQDAIYRGNFYMDLSGCGCYGTQVGSAIKITEESDRDYVYCRCTCIGNGTDYYFPFVKGRAANVTVQATSLAEGAIVTTVGMNGCALEVRYSQGSYIFYHDSDGNSMSDTTAQGHQVCRITANDYWDDVAYKEYMDMYFGQWIACQFICVYSKGIWHVGCFGFSFDGSNKIQKIIAPRNGKYRGFFNDTTSVIK